MRWRGENVSTTEVENIVSEYEKISEAVVYGVEIPNTNGRAGMAAITLKEGMTLDDKDLSNMAQQFKSELPAYAVPVFLRLQQQMETTGTFKYSKNKLKEESFNPELAKDDLYVLLPNETQYRLITPEIYTNIQESKYRF